MTAGRKKFGALAIALALVLGQRAAASAVTGAAVDVPGFEPITSSLEARGDADGFLKVLAEIVAAKPESDEAALALLRIAEVRSEAADPAAVLRPALEKAVAARIPNPRTRDRALNLLASIYAEAGEWDRARATVAGRGIVRDWLVMGPFGFTQRALHDRSFAIETAGRARILDVGETFDGTAGKVGFRKVALGPLADSVKPAEHIEPDSGAAYLLAQIRAPAGAKGILTIECRGSFKAWLNGALVANVDRAADYQPVVVHLAVSFGGGFERLLVKDTQAGTAVGARVVAADGSGPIAGMEVEAAERIHPLATHAGSAEPFPAYSVPDGGRPFARAAAALELAELGMGPLAIDLIAPAVKEEARSAHLAYYQSRLLEEAEHLPEARRTNDARAAISLALERDPNFLPALDRKARFLEDDGRPEEALRALRALAKEHPGYAPAHSEAALIARKQGFEAEALEEIARLEELRPRSALPKLLLADYYFRKENRTRALELYRKAGELDRSASWIEERIAALALQTGDLARAQKIHEDLVARYPDDAGSLRGLAEVFRTKHEPLKAADLLARAADMGGGDPDDYERIADYLIESGHEAEAIPFIERALRVEPGRHTLRRLLARIGSETSAGGGRRFEAEADFAREFAVDVMPGLATAPGAERYPKAHTICLLDQTVSRIYQDGSQVDTVHQAYKLLDDAGVARYHTLRIPGDILEIRTIGDGGKVYEPIITDNTSEILMPRLEPGAVIEYRYRTVRPRRPTFQFDSGEFYFKDPSLIEPFERSMFVVIVDKGFDFETIERNMPERPRIDDRGDTVVYTWDIRHSDRVEEEAFMPERDEILPHVELVQRRSWEDMSELYRERFMGRTRLTPEIRAKALEVTEGAAGDSAKARKLYEFVLDHVRSDTGGDTASEILLERGGPRSILLRALLDAAGVPSRFAMCAENPLLSPVQVWDPPRPDLMTHPALRIEPSDGDAVWVFDGGRFLPYGLVPSAFQAASAMLLGPAGAEMRVVPTVPLEDMATLASLGIELDGRDARVRGKTVVREAGVYSFKERILTATHAQLENLIEAQVGQVFRGASLKGFDFPGLAEPGVPLTITFEAGAPDWVIERNGRLAMKTGLGALDLTRTFGGKPTREHPLVLRMERAQHDAIDIDLGGGYDIEALPPDLVLKDRFAQYSLTYAVEDGKIRIVRSFALLPARIEPDEYGSVLRFCREVDAAEKKWIELRSTKEG